MRSRLETVPALLVAALVFTACGDGSPSALDPQGPEAQRLADLWWVLLALSGLVLAIVLVLLLGGLWRRRGAVVERSAETDTDDTHDTEDRLSRLDRRFVVGGGVILPVIILLLLGAVTVDAVVAIGNDDGDFDVEVVGKQFWWEVRYPDTGAVTANEVHIPAGRPVRVKLTSTDVIHSFWVPELAGKRDTVPGRENTMVLEADRPGVYRGQCAEFCGLQHANMAVYVVAHPADEFDAWLRNEAGDAVEPSSAMERQGRDVFATSACAGCHTIRGTRADGDVGPDLTHLASRRSLGAGAVENSRANLAGWVVDAQSIKPGSAMPAISIDADELRALLAYLESLE